MVPTLEELPDEAQVSRGTKGSQRPPAPLGLLQRQLAPIPKGTLGGCRQGEAMFTLLWLIGSQELVLGEHSFLSCGRAGALGPSKELALGLSLRTEDMRRETQRKCLPKGAQ